ncbi:unnamed protein product, partial [Cladocopium goreaui]
LGQKIPMLRSRGSTRRHFLRPQGWDGYRSTREGNRLARRLCYLLELAYRKGCYYIVEQPVSSLLFCYKPLRRLLKRHGAIRVTCALGAYHAPTLKQVILWGTAPFLSDLALQPSPFKRSQLRKVRSFLKLETTKVYIDGKGRKRCVRAPCAVCALVYPNCQNTARPFKGKMFNFTLFRDIPIILPARDVPKKTP